jgi:hypothetical protein
MWAYDSLADLLMIDLGPSFLVLFGLSVVTAQRDLLLGAYFAGAVRGPSRSPVSTSATPTSPAQSSGGST